MLSPMNEKLAELEQLQALRLRVLEAVYEQSGANPHRPVEMADVFKQAGVEWLAGDKAYRFLQSERLLVGEASHRLAITHEGVKEIEEVVAKRGREQTGTAHFLPQVINVVQNFHAPMTGAVQVGGQGNVATVKNASGATGGDLVALVTELREHASALPDGEREVALEHVEKLHSEASSGSANELRMKVWLAGLRLFPSLLPILERVAESLSSIGA
jgi:hypothetical protein